MGHHSQSCTSLFQFGLCSLGLVVQHATMLRHLAFKTLMLVLLLLPSSDVANAATTIAGTTASTVDLSVQKIFAMLFLMLGPFKVLNPFVELTVTLEPRQRTRTATVAIFFSALALLLAGLLGQQILENFDISVPVVALTGGLVLFMMALQTVLAQSGVRKSATVPPSQVDRPIAINPLAFPIIVTPYGIAAVIVFTTLAQGNGELKMMIAATIALILAVDWLVMVYAVPIQRWLGTTLQIVAIVLGVVQIALGLQVIVKSLTMLGVLQLPGG